MIARVGHVDPRRYHLILNSSQVNSRGQGVSRLISSFFFVGNIAREDIPTAAAPRLFAASYHRRKV